MILDAGILTTYELVNVAERGLKPTFKLKEVEKYYYGERMVTYSRQYASMGVNQQIDQLVRIREDKSIRIHMYCALDDGEQYRIDNVQHMYDEDGLKVTELTLYRLEELYDIAEQVDEDAQGID